jgi:hypothetical protein
VRAILADNNVEGHVRALALILEGEDWREVWASLGRPVLDFRDVGLAPTVSDAALWQTCQQQQIVLLTANRNAVGPDSLEVTLRTQNKPDSLPVLTLADPGRVIHSRAYAERVVERLLECLIDIDNYRGTGRVYLP